MDADHMSFLCASTCRAISTASGGPTERPYDITLSVDEQVAARAREAAQKLGKSLNQVVPDYLEQLAGGVRRGQQWTEFEQRCLQSNGQLGDWHFDRDEANAR
jgi:hypothetical protein